jgi:hypothetical protein
MVIMKDRKVALVCMLASIAVSLALVFSVLFSSTSAQYVPYTSEYSTYELNVDPPVGNGGQIQYYYPLANFSLLRGDASVGVFERLGMENFEPGIEYQETSTMVTHTDNYSYLAVHKTLTTAVEVSAVQSNALKFELEAGTGAIRDGDAILVGSEDASGMFVFSGEVTAAVDNANVLFDMPAGSKVIFRADPSPDKTIGSAIAGGKVAGEFYLSDTGWGIVEDSVGFEDVGMSTLAASEELVQVEILGSLQAGKALVFHVADPYLSYGAPEDINVQLDGEAVKEGKGMSETLWENTEARYFAVKTQGGFDIVVYVPQISDNIITIKSAESDLGIDGMATLLAAIGIVGVAVLALIKKD